MRQGRKRRCSLTAISIICEEPYCCIQKFVGKVHKNSYTECFSCLRWGRSFCNSHWQGITFKLRMDGDPPDVIGLPSAPGWPIVSDNMSCNPTSLVKSHCKKIYFTVTRVPLQLFLHQTGKHLAFIRKFCLTSWLCFNNKRIPPWMWLIYILLWACEC